MAGKVLSTLGMGCLGVFFVLVLLLLGQMYLFEIPIYFVFGWFWFIGDALGRVTVNGAAVATFVLCLGAFVAGVHWFGRWCYGEWTERRGERKTWRMRWTFCVAGLVVLLFTSGIACIGLMHQAVWLAATNEKWVVSERMRAPGWAYGEAYDLLYEDKNGKKLSNAQVEQAVRKIVARYDGKMQLVVAKDRNGEWAAIIELLRKDVRGYRQGGVVGVFPRDEEIYDYPRQDLAAVLAYFAQLPSQKEEAAPAPKSLPEATVADTPASSE